MNYPTEDSDPKDRYSQMAISMELLFSDTEVSDPEFALIAETLGGLETKYKQGLMSHGAVTNAN